MLRSFLQRLFSFFLCTVYPVTVYAADTIESSDYQITAKMVVQQLDHPWSLLFLPGGDMLVSERNGGIKRINQAGLASEVTGIPDFVEKGQGGLMGLALSADFPESRILFISFAEGGNFGKAGTSVYRAKLSGNNLEEGGVIFRSEPKLGGGRHFGGRLMVDDNALYVTLGDRGHRDRSQALTDHIGTLLKLTYDGDPYPGNPFIGKRNSAPEIYSFGHRNIQGIAKDANGRVWIHEHGPQGGDEINLISAGKNYGWPVITYGVNYGLGTQIGEGTHKKGMEQPDLYWVPSIAPSGMTFYEGEMFPEWKGDLLVGSLKFGLLVRLGIDEKGKVAEKERLLDGRFGRVRDVVSGPDGAVYLLTDEGNGKVIQLTRNKG
ncbi:PQQ-dependent sugar dehydrogenase [Parasalinivibrio latis]|uniref:PQQ-dependent sugar dehydrogenase n=1 Tax=Parasalinivibrio latis TaxID=2952610 RepID=UPI0030E5B724